MKEEYVQVCPKCGSPDISSDFSQPALVMGGIYPKTCNHCGHTAKIFPEIEMKDLKMPLPKKEVKGRQLQSQEYSKGWFGIIKILAPLGIFLGIIISFYNTLAGVIILVYYAIFTYLTFNQDKNSEIKKYIVVMILLGYIIGIITSFYV